MKKYLFSTETSQKDYENYKETFGDYLQSIFGYENKSDLKDEEVYACFKSEFGDAEFAFFREFHCPIPRTAVVCQEMHGGISVVDVCEDDIYNTIKLCQGEHKEIYIEDGELRFNSSDSGNLLVRFAKEGYIFEENDFFSHSDFADYTEPAGDFLEKAISHSAVHSYDR